MALTRIVCRFRASCLRAKRLDRGREMLFAAAGENDGGAEAGELAGVAETDSGPAAGDDADAPFERFFWKHSTDCGTSMRPSHESDHISGLVFGRGDEASVAGGVVDDDGVADGVVGRIELNRFVCDR